MKKYFSILIIITLSVPFNSYAQQKSATISFNELVHNFGKIDEEKGTVNYKFEFTNTGSQALIIQNVMTSCGCTTPSWTKEPVKPGEKGFVDVAYNPASRPGKFEKYITVQSTANPSTVQLRITGEVNPKPLSLEEQYPYPMGGLRLKSNQISYGTIYKGQQKSNIIEMINVSDSPQTIKVAGLPSYLTVNIPDATLAPKKTGIIEVTFNTEIKNDWGFVIDRINLSVNDRTDVNSRIIVSANIDEDFNSLTAEQKANAPVISFDDKNFDFGKIKRGEIINHEYRFTNKGKSNLLIRKVVATCGCTAVNISEQVISPGKSGIIKASFNTTGYSGSQNKTITVISNDPSNSKVMLWIRGEVVDPSM